MTRVLSISRTSTVRGSAEYTMGAVRACVLGHQVRIDRVEVDGVEVDQGDAVGQTPVTTAAARWPGGLAAVLLIVPISRFRSAGPPV
jgi:hypothetical protein